MTQNEIIEMAKESDLVTWLNTSQNFSSGVWWIEAHEPDDCLFKFAKLVAQHEREACAELCEEIGSKDNTFYREESSSGHCADAIRARGQA